MRDIERSVMGRVGNSAMRVGIGINEVLDARELTLAKQLGIDTVLLWEPVIPSMGDRWEFIDLLQLRTTCEEAGLRLEAIENTPRRFYDKAMLGLPGRDEQIENYQETLRNLGRAGIPVLGFNWAINGVWRTSMTTPGRGGARSSSFDLDLVRDAPLTHGRVYQEEELWESFAYFIRAIAPVAEEAGVRLALHPDDPPVESLGGVPRLLRSFDGFKRAIELAQSPALGLNFCLGSWSEMGSGVIESIHYFGERNRIVYVHFRDVQGSVPRFRECFLGEGNVDLVEALRALHAVGFGGFMIDDHVPLLVEDPLEYTNLGRGHAHAVGYMSALLEAIGHADAGSNRTLGRDDTVGGR